MSKYTRRFNQYQANHSSSLNAGKSGFTDLIKTALLIGLVMVFIWLLVSILLFFATSTDKPLNVSYYSWQEKPQRASSSIASKITGN